MRAFACAILSLFLFPAWMWAGTRTVLLADDSSQAIQNARADADDLSRMRDRRMIRRFLRKGYLVRVPTRTSTYYLHGVPGPYRYCRPWTKVFLERLSRQFDARFKQPLRVTSLVRTVGRQERLGRRNDNAADAVGSLRSSHLTGATVDISKRNMSPRALQWMRDVLYSLRRQGYLYAVEEFEQPVFHIMVYRNYPQHVRRVTHMARTRNRGNEVKQVAERSETNNDRQRAPAAGDP
jgi:hypothetical protein